jgi:hypothetical protein
MFFNRTKIADETAPRVGLTDGIEAKVAAFVKDWGSFKRGTRQPVTDSTEPPLQLLTDRDVAYFLRAMEDEASSIDLEIEQKIADRKRAHLAEIAQKDAQMASIRREIEATEARIRSQFDEIDRRANARCALLDVVRNIDATFDASKILKDADIRREIVRRKFGDVAVEGRSEAYVDERFESLEARTNVDPFARVVADGIAPTVQDGKAAADKAYAEYVQSLKDGYKGTKH